MNPHPTLSQLAREAVQRSGLTAYRLSWKTGLHADACREFLSGERDLRMSSIDKIIAAAFPNGIQLIVNSAELVAA